VGKKLAYESYELVVLRISMFWCFGRKWGMKGMSVFIYLDLLFSLCAVTPRSSYPVQDSWPKHQDLHDSWPRNINWLSKNSLLPSLTNDFLTPSFLNQWLASASTQGKKTAVLFWAPSKCSVRISLDKDHSGMISPGMAGKRQRHATTMKPKATRGRNDTVNWCKL
jgi:hypothetical protein